MATRRVFSDFDDADKARIRKALDELVDKLADELDSCPEAVGNEVFYRSQKSPSYGRNPTKTQKNASYKHSGGNCARCGDPVSPDEANFHHRARGVRAQHGPENMPPYHEGCHNEEHGAKKGSLRKGGPRRKA